MKQTYYYFIGGILLTLIFIVALYFIVRNPKNNKLTVKQFSNKIENKDYDYLLDVRTPEEWNQGHHKDAILIPIANFVSDLPKLVLNKNAKLLLYCKKGIRAEATAKIAERLGYKNIYWMDGEYEDLKKIS
jgi:rhodanese-related sulfurtransferase